MIEDIKAICNGRLGTLAYFYFDFKDSSKRDIRSLLSSILFQLSDQSDESWSILYRLYTTHREGLNQPREADLTKCLQDMLNVNGRWPTFIIVDAVDECPSTPGFPSAREKVLSLMETLVGSPPICEFALQVDLRKIFKWCLNLSHLIAYPFTIKVDKIIIMSDLLSTRTERCEDGDQRIRNWLSILS